MDLYSIMDDISRANARINVLYSEWARRHGMSYSMMMVLFALKHQGPRTQKDIVNEWLIPKQTVNTIIRELSEEGLVVMEEGRNHKEKLISFTEEGRMHADEALREMEEIEVRCLEKMGHEKSTELFSLLNELSDVMEDEIDA